MTESDRKQQRNIISDLCEENVRLAEDIELQKMLVENATDTVKVITAFYANTFHEIFQHGLDVSALETVKFAIMPEQMLQFKRQIHQLYRLSRVIGEEMPSIKVFEGFYRLLENLSAMKKAVELRNGEIDSATDTQLRQTILSEVLQVRKELKELARLGAKPMTAADLDASATLTPCNALQAPMSDRQGRL